MSHYGKTINSGRYIASVIEELSEGFPIVQCNDTTIAPYKPTKSIIIDVILNAMFTLFCMNVYR